MPVTEIENQEWERIIIIIIQRKMKKDSKRS